jgi:hypothetical protein
MLIKINIGKSRALLGYVHVKYYNLFNCNNQTEQR